MGNDEAVGFEGNVVTIHDVCATAEKLTLKKNHSIGQLMFAMGPYEKSAR